MDIGFQKDKQKNNFEQQTTSFGISDGVVLFGKRKPSAMLVEYIDPFTGEPEKEGKPKNKNNND